MSNHSHEEEFQNVDWLLHPAHCKTCKKEIYPTYLWAYKDDTGYYCSWKCLRDKQKKKKEQKQKRIRTKRIEQISSDGTTVIAVYNNRYDAADAVNGKDTGIGIACRTGTMYKGYFWRYYVDLNKGGDVKK